MPAVYKDILKLTKPDRALSRIDSFREDRHYWPFIPEPNYLFWIGVKTPKRFRCIAKKYCNKYFLIAVFCSRLLKMFEKFIHK